MTRSEARAEYDRAVRTPRSADEVKEDQRLAWELLLSLTLLLALLVTTAWWLVAWLVGA